MSELSVFFLNAQALPTVHYENPGLMPDPNSTIWLSSIYRDNNVAGLALNNQYIVRKSIVGNLSIWDINNYTLKYQLLWNTPIFFFYYLLPLNPIWAENYQDKTFAVKKSLK